MSATKGSLGIVVGDPEMGKSTWVATSYLPQELRRRPDRAIVYHSPNADDRLPPPFQRMTPGMVQRRGMVPRALHLVGCTALEAIQFVQRCTKARIPILLVIDEAHDVAPNYGATFQERYSEDERRELRRWVLHLLRQGRHEPLDVLFVSPSIAGLHPEVWRFAKVTVYFGQGEPPDLKAIEGRYGARAALEVSKLQPFRFIVANKRALPPGWDGYRGTLERRAKQ